MNLTIGTLQVNSNYSEDGSGIYFGGRWVSDIVGQSGINANTWTISFGYLDDGGSGGPFYVALYIWRPSTSTKIATIFDSSVAQNITSVNKREYILTFAGSAVASGTIQTNDVLCMEILCFTDDAGFTVNSGRYYYDGTTEAVTNNSTFTSVASYLSTPETLLLGVPVGIAATVTDKVVTNKIITHG